MNGPEMSGAALPPRRGHFTEGDRRHPLFPLYEAILASRRRQLLDAPDFQDFVYQHRRDLEARRFTQEPDYPAFLAWMRENKGGARACPAGAFPENFLFWKEGGRW